MCSVYVARCTVFVMLPRKKKKKKKKKMFNSLMWIVFAYSAVMSFSATPEETICAAFLNGNCLPGGECVSLHHYLPYLWQGWLEASGAWVDLTEPGVVLEKAFSLPGTVACNTQVSVSIG